MDGIAEKGLNVTGYPPVPYLANGSAPAKSCLAGSADSRFVFALLLSLDTNKDGNAQGNHHEKSENYEGHIVLRFRYERRPGAFGSPVMADYS